MNKNKTLLTIISITLKRIFTLNNNNKELLITYFIKDLRYNYINLKQKWLLFLKKLNINFNSSILLTHVSDEYIQKKMIKAICINLCNKLFNVNNLNENVVQIIYYILCFIKKLINNDTSKKLRVSKIIGCINLVLTIIYIFFENNDWKVGLI